MRLQNVLLGAVGALLAGTVFLGGCTPKITQEQLQRLRELRAQERQLLQDIQRKEADKSRIQGEISSRKGELGRCQENERFVREKLAAWPNVWPDYTVPSAQDTTAAPGVEVRTKKKPR